MSEETNRGSEPLINGGCLLIFIIVFKIVRLYCNKNKSVSFLCTEDFIQKGIIFQLGGSGQDGSDFSAFKSNCWNKNQVWSMNDVTWQTEDLFVNGKFSQIIFIPIVWQRREGWHQEAEGHTV